MLINLQKGDKFTALHHNADGCRGAGREHSVDCPSNSQAGCFPHRVMLQKTDNTARRCSKHTTTQLSTDEYKSMTPIVLLNVFLWHVTSAYKSDVSNTVYKRAARISWSLLDDIRRLSVGRLSQFNEAKRGERTELDKKLNCLKYCLGVTYTV